MTTVIIGGQNMTSAATIGFTLASLEDFFRTLIITSLISLTKGFGGARCSLYATVKAVRDVLSAENVPEAFIMSYQDGGTYIRGNVMQFMNSGYTCLDELSDELTLAIRCEFPFGAAGCDLAEWIAERSTHLACSLAPRMARLTRCCIEDETEYAMAYV